MSLNADALDELDKETTFVKEPEIDDHIKDKAIIKVEQPEDGDVAVKSMIVLQDYDTSLQTTENGISRLHSLDEITETVLSSETINQSTAEELSRVFESFSETVAPSNEFTQVPTRTHLKATQNFVQSEIQKEQQEVLNSFIQFINTEANEAQALLNCITDERYPQVAEQLEELNHQAILDLKEASQSRNFLLYNRKNELVDFRLRTIHDGIGYEDFENIPEAFPVETLIRGLFRSFNDLEFRDLHATAYAFNRLNQEELMKDYQKDRDVYVDFNYLSLLSYFAENRIGIYLQATHEEVMAIQEEIYPKLDLILKEGNVEEKLVQIEELLPRVRSYLRGLTRFYRHLNAARQFAHYSKEYMRACRNVLNQNY